MSIPIITNPVKIPVTDKIRNSIEMKRKPIKQMIPQICAFFFGVIEVNKNYTLL